jgi:hypothetical protein
LENGGAKLFVDKNAGFFAGYAILNGRPKRIVDHLLRCGHVSGLLDNKGAAPAEYFRLKRASMIEGQDIERFVKANGSHTLSLAFR